MDVLAKISLARRFLFDFGMKLLYGVHEVISGRLLNLEEAAIGGRFPTHGSVLMLLVQI
ncbi:hypothetical protein SLEP1_g21026 [Rubroshorea leprosula]|uniref:DCD domain-containing protein n=1 Tax=Rubroshorea leprosula TaxID=152421 RepID=A0AAV5JAP5_9ROSI|nr:hypothetical protein SLEP1_g21026 [Rubroshorea leprosula]